MVGTITHIYRWENETGHSIIVLPIFVDWIISPYASESWFNLFSFLVIVKTFTLYGYSLCI